eukprot:3126516-Rhodomonas_salina.1
MEVNMLKTKATAMDFATGEVPEDLNVEATRSAAVQTNERKTSREVCELRFDGDHIDFVQPSEPMPYLGYELTLTGNWKAEVEKIRRKTARIAS